DLVTAVTEVAEEFDPRRERADHVAVAASQALAQLARGGIDVSAAADELARQLDREPRVATPAAIALGSGGTLAEADALVTVAADQDADENLRVAAAEALGGILSRADRVPPEVLRGLMRLAAD